MAEKNVEVKIQSIDTSQIETETKMNKETQNRTSKM